MGRESRGDKVRQSTASSVTSRSDLKGQMTKGEDLHLTCVGGILVVLFALFPFQPGW